MTEYRWGRLDADGRIIRTPRPFPWGAVRRLCWEFLLGMICFYCLCVFFTHL
jgi:hypothetical protein